MGDDDQWRADGSFRGRRGGSTGAGDGVSRGGGRGGGGGGGGKRGPQFTRVIPKFLQKYQQPSEILAKFAAPEGAGDDDDGELDDVQRAAMDEYLHKRKDKKDEKDSKEAVDATGADTDSRASVDASAEVESAEASAKKTGTQQRVVELGAARKKRKRKETGKILSNKKLLSFSMDDEE